MTPNNIYKQVLCAISEEKDLKALHQKYQLKDAIIRMDYTSLHFEKYGDFTQYVIQHFKSGVDHHFAGVSFEMMGDDENTEEPSRICFNPRPIISMIHTCSRNNTFLNL
ncbi:MAG: hypothetical protein OEL56_07415 [Nitrosopumilus sp.]|nr:hypothetical protein [Nitrosopumilus sp.]MDH3517001.1 hypothetical protein [Nitrosopumilus sp.]MDH3565699.1 hypothetical protein [Nitrosopumilus sp.]MDH5416557.1 hypothetical protein [Nitrosopumilus sp.]MDH5555157.1 hypothetical protein [Nitrosopumilus sp.]